MQKLNHAPLLLLGLRLPGNHLPVAMVEHQLTFEPDHVYIMPDGANLSLENGQFLLNSNPGGNTPPAR